MATCAVIQSEDKLVVNKIVAEVTDTPPDGTFLVQIEDGVQCEIGWFWDGSTFIGVANGN